MGTVDLPAPKNGVSWSMKRERFRDASLKEIGFHLENCEFLIVFGDLSEGKKRWDWVQKWWAVGLMGELLDWASKPTSPCSLNLGQRFYVANIWLLSSANNKWKTGDGKIFLLLLGKNPSLRWKWFSSLSSSGTSVWCHLLFYALHETRQLFQS
jgi:hypothetical protein